jgi:hypothetical protein
MTQALTIDEFAAYVRLQFEFQPLTGDLVRKAYRGKGLPVTTTNTEGYLVTKVRGRQYRVHRLAWLMVHGAWPEHEIDHINGVKTDNRLGNLRDVSPALNQHNKRLPQGNNSTGFLGVTRRNGRYAAQIERAGRQVQAGSFDTPQEASAAYLAAKAVYHPGFAPQ